MEYDIEILVEEFSDSHFAAPAPYTTPWGTAYRATEVGKLFWRPDLYVEPYPVRPSLLSHLPPSWRTVEWRYLTMSGEGLFAFEQAVNSLTPSPDATEAVYSLFQELLEKQSRWAVFFWYQCDDISVLYYQSVEELCETIITAYQREGDEPRGFYSLSRSAAFPGLDEKK